MMSTPTEFLTGYLRELHRCLDELPLQALADVAARLVAAYREDRLVAIVGNGGSAATASHMACDLGKTILGATPTSATRRFRVLAMTDNVPLITAWANDVGYHHVFSEQIRTWVRQDDLVIVISGSGNSANIVEAVTGAQAQGAYTIGFLGFDGGRVRGMVDQAVVVNSQHYGQIEDVHAIFGHMLTAYVKQAVLQDSLPLPYPHHNGHRALKTV